MHIRQAEEEKANKKTKLLTGIVVVCIIYPVLIIALLSPYLKCIKKK
jgi:nitrate reductase NapE component